MTAKEYLEQAHFINQRINGKLEQLAELRGLATKVTSTLSDMPGNPNRNSRPVENAAVKIADLDSEINAEIDRLVDLKAEITRTINKVDNLEYRTLLELRYLCFKTWAQIAVEMDYNIRWVYRMHGKALDAIKSCISQNKP